MHRKDPDTDAAFLPFPEKAYSIGSGMGELSKETLTLSQLLETVKALVAAYCNQEA